MKKNWLLLTGLFAIISPLAANEKTSSLQEGVELRRIAEYCKEKNFTAVKSQVDAFINRHPHSESIDALIAMLGDIYFSENDYLAALTAYDRIETEELIAKTEFRRIHCLHQLSRFDDVITATIPFITEQQLSKPEVDTLRLQLANAIFRRALATEEVENKKKLFQRAKEQFKLLKDTEYADQSLLPLAHIHSFLKEYPEAVKIYFALAEQDAQNKEEYLLQVVQLQLRFDRTSAIETCGKIYALNGPAAPQAAFNQLALLFQEKRYRDVIHFQDKAFHHISKQYLHFAHYYVGRSLYHIGDYLQAAPHLVQFLTYQNEDLSQVKNAQLTLLHCAKENDDFDLFERTLADLKVNFPKDDETVKATLLHSQLCRGKGKFSEAAVDLKELLDGFPDLAQKDHVLFDYALLLSKQKKWLESAQAFHQFIHQYPAHLQSKNAWRHLLFSRFNAIKEASTDTAFMKKEELTSTLTHALRQKSVFSAEECQRMRLTLAKTLCEIKKYERALEELSEYVKDYEADANLSDAYLLMALAHYNGTNDLDLFALHAEKALHLDPQIKEAPELHISLFNTYLSQAEKIDEDGKRELLLKAADHLYSAIDHPVKKENQLWLAHYYFQQYQEASDKQSSIFLDRAIFVLEKILVFDPNHPSLGVPQNKLEMEGEAVKLAELYSKSDRNRHKIALLVALTEEYKKFPELAWKYQRLALFDLATAYREENLYSKALSTYTFLIDSSTYTSSYFATAAQLEKALLQYFLLDVTKRVEHGPELQKICDALKDLEIKRKLFSEPNHLEAALSYVDIMSEICNKTEQIDRRMQLLAQVKEGFSSAEDPLVGQYLSTKHEFGDKYALYEQYLTFISIDMLKCRALTAFQGDDKANFLELGHQAIDELDLLLPEISHPRLKERADRCREELKKLL